MVVFTFSDLYQKYPFLLSMGSYESRDLEIGSCRQQGLFIWLYWMRPWIAFVHCLRSFQIIQNVNKFFISHVSVFCLKNYKLSNLDWTFYLTWIMLVKKKLISFDRIVDNLIIHKLLINYLNLIKESIQEAAATPGFWICFKKSEVAVSRCSSK